LLNTEFPRLNKNHIIFPKKHFFSGLSFHTAAAKKYFLGGALYYLKRVSSKIFDKSEILIISCIGLKILSIKVRLKMCLVAKKEKKVFKIYFLK